MTVVPCSPRKRGLALLAAHCASLDPDTPSARDRLEVALGAELAHKLVFALSRARAPGRQRTAA
jgi:hypothetical protein